VLADFVLDGLNAPTYCHGVPSKTLPDHLSYSDDVAEALLAGKPVVALESTIISHGLPKPRNLEIARQLEEVVRANGAHPATIAVLNGRPHIGLADSELESLANGKEVAKLGMRDLPLAGVTGISGGTTVSATAYLAALAGIRVFATGGLGGVHRGWIDSWDESADLDALSRVKMTIVCAGVKSILDVPATLQRLETLNVLVAGYQTRSFPGFYLRESGETLEWSLETPSAVADAMRGQDALEIDTALVIANPVSAEDELDRDLHDRVLAAALEAAGRSGARGKELTPFLLSYMLEGTDGASLEANVAAVRGNAAIAARIAAAWSGDRTPAQSAAA
jgi:pseudouridylate synthase